MNRMPLMTAASLLLASHLICGCAANGDKADDSSAPQPQASAPAKAPATAPATQPRGPSARAESAAAVKPGVPGGVFVETQTLISDVTQVDAAKRTITLATPDKGQLVVTCGPEVENFDQIRVGDQLKITVTEQLVIAMAPDGTAAGEDAAGMVALAPKGAKPAGVMAAVVELRATVSAIDVEKQKATLRFSDGSTRVVAVRPDVDLKQRKVGESVVIRATQVVALSVERP